jgi:hypothetical protein
MIFYYEDDKIMLLDSGEVLTVQEDLGDEVAPGIVVKEEIGRRLIHGEVRPAGHTRQRYDLARAIVAPDAPPPLPENCLQLESPGDLADELHPDDEPAQVEPSEEYV